MDFTRDPIIETIISPKDGFKLSVRSSRLIDQEEYLVNALEVVSFGSALFFRSVEKPKVFLLPISDYEVMEVKEARMVLKNVSVDKPIKIGEGKASSSDDSDSGKSSSKRKNSRKRRPSPKVDSQVGEGQESPKKPIKAPKPIQSSPKEGGGSSKDEAVAPSSIVPRALPTPPKIIERRLPSPVVEEVPEGDVLSDELVSDNGSGSEAVEADSHHEQETPNLDGPVQEAPTTEAPTTEAPATDAPATDAPATDAPTKSDEEAS